MEDLEELLGGTTGSVTSGANHASNSRGDNVTSVSSQSSQWCSSCQKQARELEEKYSRNFIAIKQKIFFTDNLIQMYQKTKKQLEEATERCNQALKDKSLKQAQLELLLSKEQPSLNEIEDLRARNASLEDQVEDLKTKLHAMDESRKMHEESLKVLRAEDNGAVKKFSQQLSDTKKELAEKSDECKKLRKKCKTLERRVEKLSKGRKKHNIEQGTDISDGTENATVMEQTLNDVTTTDMLMNSGVESSEDVESAKSAENIQPDLSAQSTNQGTEPKEKVAHITSTLAEKDSQDQTRNNSDIVGLTEKAKRSFPTELTELQISELSVIATKWKELACKKPGPKKQDLISSLLKNISEFCLLHQKESRNFVLRKFLDLHKDLYSIRHRRWITDVLKGGDVLIKKSSSPDFLTHTSHCSNDEVAMMSSADDSEVTESEPLDTMTAIRSDHDHVSVMPDISDDTDADRKSKETSPKGIDQVSNANLPATTEKKRKASTGDSMETRVTEFPKETNQSVAKIIPSTLGRDEYEGRDEGNLFAAEPDEKEAEELFIAQPTEVQMSDLNSIAIKWRASVCKRPSSRKQVLIEELLMSISQFCSQHHISSEKVVLNKFYQLHQNLYSKKYRHWIKDMISNSDVSIKKCSSPIVIGMSDSAIEDKTRAINLEVVKDEPLSVVVSKKEESVTIGGSDAQSLSQSISPIYNRRSDEHVPVLHDVSGSDSVFPKEKDSDTIEEEAEVISNNPPSIIKRKRQFSEDSEKADKKQKMDVFHLPEIVSRRRTRSMQASSSSEQEDSKETQPLRQNRRRKSSKSTGSGKKLAKLSTGPKATVHNSVRVRESKSNITDIIVEKTLISEGDKIATVRNTAITGVSKKQLELCGSSMEKSELTMSQKKFVSITNESMSGFAPVPPISVDSPTESLNVFDIFEEMMPVGTSHLSPLPHSPFLNEETEEAEKMPAVEECQLEHEISLRTEDIMTPLPDDHRGRDSISPSTDLCTVLNFGTPKKAIHQKTSETEDSSKTLVLDDQGVKMKQDSTSSTECDIIIDGGDALDSMHPESPLLLQSDVMTDILKPRRFSCEAPEKAVSVPPIKPSSDASCLERIRSPLVANLSQDSGQSSSFPPLRKEGDIPSHWHQSTSHSKGDKSDMEKELLLSDDEEYLHLPMQHHEVSADDATADVSACSDYDMDLVMKDMTSSSPLLSAIESETDLKEISKSNNGHVPVSFPKKYSSDRGMKSPAKGADSKIIANDMTINRAPLGSGTSSADEISLIMDLSDDVVAEKEVEPDSTSVQTIPHVETIQDNDKHLKLHSMRSHPVPVTPDDNGSTCSAVKSKSSSKSNSKKNNVGDESYYITTARDLKSTFTKKERGQSRKVIVKDSFVAEGIASVLEETKTEFDLFTKEGDKSEGFTIKDLPHCEGKFLRQIHILHTSGIVEADFLMKTVIPVLLKIHDKLGYSYSDVRKLPDEGGDTCYAKLHLFLSRMKSTLGVSLSRMLAFMRVFVFVCKMADTVAPLHAVCRYHLLWTRATKLVVSLIQGLLCWPSALKRQPVLGKTVMRVLRKSVGSSQVLSRKSQAVGLVQQLDWIDDQCCWQTTSVRSTYYLSDLKSTVDDAIGRIEAAAFSAEFKQFLDSKDKNKIHGDALQKIPIFDQDTIIGLHLLDFLPKESVVDDVKGQIIDKRFWPLLNAWSQHLHIHGTVDKNSKVSNACTMAVLHSFSQILSAYLLRQKHMHKDQPTVPKLQSHYKVICSLMDNLATLYLCNAPKLVQCATASFLIRTCFCNPSAAFQSLLKWAKATASTPTLKCKRHEDLPLVIILSECDELSLKQICVWLDEICSKESEGNLVKCLWPD